MSCYDSPNYTQNPPHKCRVYQSKRQGGILSDKRSGCFHILSGHHYIFDNMVVHNYITYNTFDS